MRNYWPSFYQISCSLIFSAAAYTRSVLQKILLSEPRLLNPEEQKLFCAKISDSISGLSIRCVILDQIIATRDTNPLIASATDFGYSLDITYEISSDSSGVSTQIADVVNSAKFREAAAFSFEMDVSIQFAEIVTTPTQSPTRRPSLSPTSPSTAPTGLPTVSSLLAALCSGSSIFHLIMIVSISCQHLGMSKSLHNQLSRDLMGLRFSQLRLLLLLPLGNKKWDCQTFKH